MKSLNQRLDEAEQIIRTKSFRENKGLGNEVGYYIFDYPAEKEIEVRERITYLKKKYSKNTDGFDLIVFDLYELVIDLLEKEGFLEQCYSFEKNKGLERVNKVIANFLLLGEEDNLIVNHIKNNSPQTDAVIFLTGVGKCYPFLRSHTVLNNLHQALDCIPVVMFYPGTYDGQELVLFSKIKDDNYYRAFRLVD